MKLSCNIQAPRRFIVSQPELHIQFHHCLLIDGLKLDDRVSFTESYSGRQMFLINVFLDNLHKTDQVRPQMQCEWGVRGVCLEERDGHHFYGLLDFHVYQYIFLFFCPPWSLLDNLPFNALTPSIIGHNELTIRSSCFNTQDNVCSLTNDY